MAQPARSSPCRWKMSRASLAATAITAPGLKRSMPALSQPGWLKRSPRLKIPGSGTNGRQPAANRLVPGPKLFGAAAGEILTAWSIATYIDRVAEAGKAEYALPMYVNVWLGEGEWAIPGESDLAGGAVAKLLDIYRWYTPHLDLVAPDIYIADLQGYEYECASYARQDNPLFIPESAPGGTNVWQMWKALAKYNAIGYCFFAVEHILAADGTLRPDMAPLVESFQAAASAIPLLLKYQGAGHLYAVAQEEGAGAQRLVFEGWWGLAEWGNSRFAVRRWAGLAPPGGG